MIIDEVVLHNFGVYRGRQQIKLTPTSPKKPVILIGGLNGGGKTTLLDALQLVLYGKMARCSSRGSMAYEDFLRCTIHRATPMREGAALELQFRHTLDGEEQTYRVHRSWRQNGQGVRERIEVIHNDKFDRVLTDAWQECIEGFLPARMAPLFFFDGEQIEALADVEHSAQVLQTAVQGLLGLDLVDQLNTDLVALERRKRILAKNEAQQRDIESEQQALEQIEQQREAVAQQCGAARNNLEQGLKRLNDIDAQFRAEGGELIGERDALESQRAAVAEELQTAEAQLRDIASGPAPLLLVADLFQAVEAQAQQEEAAEAAERTEALLVDRDAALLKAALANGIDADVIRVLDDFLTADRANRQTLESVTRYLDLHHDAQMQLRHLQSYMLDHTAAQISDSLQRIEELQGQLTDIDRQLARVPERDAVAQLIEAQQNARTEVDKAQGQLGALQAELERLSRECDRKKARLQALIERTVETDFEQEAAGRVLHHAQRVRDTLAQFRERVLARHAQRIAYLVLESFRHLAHKESLITDLRIDPQHFTVALQGKDAQALSTDRLSAGERQLLAVALLWGLSRASGRPLPAVVDTPLGRLDATHRAHLVERYFPHASHQVILLSTDKEIDEIYYQKLKRSVARAYRLEFDALQDATQVRTGYFW